MTNWLDPETWPVRLLLLFLTLVGLGLSASIPAAFGDGGLTFAIAFVTMQVGRTAFTVWVFAGTQPVQYRNFVRILVWFAGAGVLWIGGAFLEPHPRVAAWTVAVLLEYTGPLIGFHVPGLGRSRTTDWRVAGEHLAERCGLFLIIALGESVLVTGSTFAQLSWSAVSVAAVLAAAIGTMVMWWLFFDHTGPDASRTIARSDDPGRLARIAYTYVPILLVAGIVLAAAADEFVLTHADAPMERPFLVAILGGYALFLVGIAVFRRVTGGLPATSHWIGVAMLLALAPIAGDLAPWMLHAIAGVVLVAVAAWDKAVTQCES